MPVVVRVWVVLKQADGVEPLVAVAYIDEDLFAHFHVARDHVEGFTQPAIADPPRVYRSCLPTRFEELWLARGRDLGRPPPADNEAPRRPVGRSRERRGLRRELCVLVESAGAAALLHRRLYRSGKLCLQLGRQALAFDLDDRLIRRRGWACRRGAGGLGGGVRHPSPPADAGGVETAEGHVLARGAQRSTRLEGTQRHGLRRGRRLERDEGDALVLRRGHLQGEAAKLSRLVGGADHNVREAALPRRQLQLEHAPLVRLELRLADGIRADDVPLPALQVVRLHHPHADREQRGRQVVLPQLEDVCCTLGRREELELRVLVPCALVLWAAPGEVTRPRAFDARRHWRGEM
mmetsp:Transcript_6099/g.15496  ORF Transcript_6099/g.15496 Transcript_6099/m.15496 type:complete len:350 (+) Transcript_6099:99-1148(+)